MRRLVYFVHCPGCGRELRGATEERRRERVLVHVRNCNAWKQEVAAAPVPLEVVAPPQEQQP